MHADTPLENDRFPTACKRFYASTKKLVSRIYWGYNIYMDISFDPAKRTETISSRGLDFADAGLVFQNRTITIEDERHDYGEIRFITAGHLAGRCIVLVWTPRDDSRRIISMRFAHAREEAAWFS